MRLILTAGQAHDLNAAPRLLAGLKCRHVVADRGYDADALLDLIRSSGAKAHIPSTRSRKQPIPHDASLYRQRHRIEIMFGRIKDWRRGAMRYGRCAHTFFSAIALAATVTFWLRQ